MNSNSNMIGSQSKTTYSPFLKTSHGTKAFFLGGGGGVCMCSLQYLRCRVCMCSLQYLWCRVCMCSLQYLWCRVCMCSLQYLWCREIGIPTWPVHFYSFLFGYSIHKHQCIETYLITSGNSFHSEVFVIESTEV